MVTIGGEYMAQPQQKIDVSLAEIYKELCPKCKQKVKALVTQKVSAQIVTPLLSEQEVK